MPDRPQDIDIPIVGAGMAGLAAASELRRTGRDVLVIDKGRGPGGRLASRRNGGATLDRGAHFLTARDPRFAAAVDRWRTFGVVEEWYRSFGDGTEGHPRWRGKPAMNEIARHLAREVPVLHVAFPERGESGKRKSGSLSRFRHPKQEKDEDGKIL